MTRPGDDGFLTRWSRRKRDGLAAEDPADAAVRAPADPAAAPPSPAADAAAPERTDAELLEDLGLPDPDALKPGDNVRGFMAEAVPERLRARALRRLWRTNPVLANLDGLLDYGEDFTDAAKVVENMQTVYRVGRGMLPDPIPEAEPETDVETAAVSSPDAATGSDEAATVATDAEAGPVPPPDGAAADPGHDPERPEATLGGFGEPHGSVPAMAASEPADSAPSRPRRMRFSLPDPSV